MLKIGKRIFIKLIYILIDCFFVVSSIYIAALIRKATLPFSVSLENLFINEKNPFRLVFVFWIFVTIFINNTNELYETKREQAETAEIWHVLRSTLISSLITIVAIYIIKIEDFPRSLLILTGIFMFLFFSVWRIAKKIFIKYLVLHGYNNFNALIVGAGKVGTALADEINKRPGLGIKMVGFLDDFKEFQPEEKSIKVLGKISDFVKIARREFINKIFITSHLESKAFIDLLEKAKKLKIAIRVIPHGFELMSGDFVKYNIGFIPILEYCNAEIARKQFGKRIFDIIAVLCSLFFFVPVFIVIAILIKIDSPGPIFYFSKRYGRSGRMFNMIKFRSMVCNADKIISQYLDKNEVDGPIFKIKEDPRITKIGKLLRKYSLDELPQLINVLKGDMSLVGPRPLPIEQIRKEDLRQLKRLEVRPGITGLWQIRGRSDISFSRLVRWDIWYINNWSFWLDLNILIQTIPVVIKGTGAY